MADDWHHGALRLLRLRERTIHMGVGRVVEAREGPVGPIRTIECAELFTWKQPAAVATSWQRWIRTEKHEVTARRVWAEEHVCGDERIEPRRLGSRNVCDFQLCA